MLEGYSVSMALMEDLDIKTSLFHFHTFGFGQYLQTELEICRTFLGVRFENGNQSFIRRCGMAHHALPESFQEERK